VILQSPGVFGSCPADVIYEMLTDGPLFVEPRALIRNLPLLLSQWKAQYLMWRNTEPPAFLAVSLKQLAAGWVRLFEDKFTEDDFIKFICGKSSLSILMQTLWASKEISETASEQMKNHEVFTGKANRRRSSLSTPPRQRVAVTVADSPTQSAGASAQSFRESFLHPSPILVPDSPCQMLVFQIKVSSAFFSL
jgi:hypothetical protein